MNIENLGMATKMAANSVINKEAPPIGIDLGTTFSCVGVYRNGKVEIVANEQGHFTTPSYVAFNKKERLFGEAAKQQMAFNAKNTIFDVKRLIGRNFDDQIVQEDMKQWPFKVISVGGIPKIEIMFRNDVKYLSAVEVSAMILVKMKTIAESYLGAKVTKAVVTCPAYFNDIQRQATVDAGKIAGMDVLAIVNEPTAASIAYGMDMDSKTRKKILVYDLGGGTFDVSIVDIRDNKVTVEATGGDPHLGGDDFDSLLMKDVLAEIELKHDTDIRNDKRALSRLRTACELAKRNLSSKNFSTIEVNALFDGTDLQATITRTNFNSLCSHLFDTTITIVKRLLQKANLSCRDIDEIVLVGGSTRIVKIQQLLQDLFKGKNILKTFHPDQVVAYGAAVFASKIQEICSTTLSLGIATKHPDASREEEMWTLISRNTPIPVEQSQIFPITDNQTRVSISVLRGQNPLARHNVQIGNLTFNGIPTNPTGTETVTVKFSIDENGILTVTAFSNTNKKAKGEITIHDTCDCISRSERQRMIVEREMYRKLTEEFNAVYTTQGEFEGFSYEWNSKNDQINYQCDEILDRSIDCGRATTAEIIEKINELQTHERITSRIEKNLENHDLLLDNDIIVID